MGFIRRKMGTLRGDFGQFVMADLFHGDSSGSMIGWNALRPTTIFRFDEGCFSQDGNIAWSLARLT